MLEIHSTTQSPIDVGKARIMLGILHAVESGEPKAQRHLAAEVGVVLGLADAYAKRCVPKVVTTVSEVSARCYSYGLSPQSFVKNARRTADHLSYSFIFFRQAQTDCAPVFDAANSRGWPRIMLLGISDAAEIAALCALDAEITIVTVVDSSHSLTRFVGVPAVASLEGLADRADGVVLCAIREKNMRVAEAYEAFCASRALALKLLAGPAREARYA